MSTYPVTISLREQIGGGITNIRKRATIKGRPKSFSIFLYTVNHALLAGTFMSLRVLVAEKLDKVQKSLMAGTNKRVVSETFDEPRVVVELVPGLGRCSE